MQTRALPQAPFPYSNICAKLQHPPPDYALAQVVHKTGALDCLPCCLRVRECTIVQIGLAWEANCLGFGRAWQFADLSREVNSKSGNRVAGC